jgi:hypothetical protein
MSVLVIVVVVVAGIVWLGLQVKPSPFPPLGQTGSQPETVPCPTACQPL